MSFTPETGAAFLMGAVAMLLIVVMAELWL